MCIYLLMIYTDELILKEAAVANICEVELVMDIFMFDEQGAAAAAQLFVYVLNTLLEDTIGVEIIVGLGIVFKLFGKQENEELDDVDADDSDLHDDDDEDENADFDAAKFKSAYSIFGFRRFLFLYKMLLFFFFLFLVSLNDFQINYKKTFFFFFFCFF